MLKRGKVKSLVKEISSVFAPFKQGERKEEKCMERIDTRERMEEIFNKLSSKTLEALEKEKR